jgi:putative transposase
MPQERLPLYVHLVWGTWQRDPLLVGDIERDLHRALGAECVALDAEPLALGGMPDHVHLLTRLPATLSVAALVKRLKGSSAHLMTHQIAPTTFFKWQPGYGAVTVSPRHLDQVATYIARQREHHASHTLIPTLEAITAPQHPQSP